MCTGQASSNILIFKKSQQAKNEQQSIRPNHLEDSKTLLFSNVFPVTKQRVKESENIERQKQLYGPAEIVEEFLGRKAVLGWSTTRGPVEAGHGFWILNSKRKERRKPQLFVFGGGALPVCV